MISPAGQPAARPAGTAATRPAGHDLLAGKAATRPAGHDLLAGKVVVITAAAGTGIGSAAARRCLEEGAVVAVSDRHAGRLAEFRDELAESHGDRVWSAACDVTDQAAVDALVAGAVRQFGRIDVLINNAGLGGTSSVLEMTDEHWLRVLDVTLNGTFRCTRAVLHQGSTAPDGQPGPRRGRGQQRVGARLARAAGAGALRGGEGRSHGAHPVRGA
jgi:NAD(P)-dependent dehydrogenase (short-subunit alcohol dehydrogenase family)